MKILFLLLKYYKKKNWPFYLIMKGLWKHRTLENEPFQYYARMYECRESVLDDGRSTVIFSTFLPPTIETLSIPKSYWYLAKSKEVYRRKGKFLRYRKITNSGSQK